MIKAIGLMSGSSLDGLDIAHCKIEPNHKSFEITKAETVAFPIDLKNHLETSTSLSGLELMKLDRRYSRWVADTVHKFITKHQLEAAVIGLHGHTVFHFPKDGLSYQMGHGSFLAYSTKIPVVTDFRTLDILAGGEGAPLAPFVNEELFRTYNLFLNLGGIANAHMYLNGESIAFDICGCNQWLNLLAKQLGKPFDNEGILARKGKIIDTLLQQLQEAHPSDNGQLSLDNTEVQQLFQTIINPAKGTIEDKLCTVCHFVAIQTANHLAKYSNAFGEVMQLSGGGAFNEFLVAQLKKTCARINVKIVVPNAEIINYKEALLIASLAAYHSVGKLNFPSSMPAYDANCVGGIWHPAPSN